MSTLEIRAPERALPQALADTARTLWLFSRPHTIVGTTLAVLVFYVLACHSTGRSDLRVLLLTYAASLAMNVYVVGLNQLTDVAIDRINKPYLPLAAGKLTRRAALAIVIVCGLGALAGAALLNRYLLGTVASIMVLGSAYSLPPLRLKSSPFWAAATITTARAVLFNLGLYVSYAAALGQAEPHLPLHVLGFVLTMFMFVVVIALMKDVPDCEGDRKHGISTLVLRLGARRTLLLCRLLLTLAYAGLAFGVLAGMTGLHAGVILVSHALGLLLLWLRARGVDPGDGRAVYRYYMFVWTLFYGEFAAFLAACLLAPTAF